MTRRNPSKEKQEFMNRLRTVAIGEVFFIEQADGTDRTLYVRENEHSVTCLVTMDGRTHADPPRHRINGTYFANGSVVTRLRPGEQVIRHMLAVHGQGARAIAALPDEIEEN